LGVKRHYLVLFLGFPAAPLEHAAVKQNVILLCGYQVHGTGDFPYCAIK
jgi:hypothetical protein